MKERREKNKRETNDGPTHMSNYRGIVVLKNYVQLYSHLPNKFSFHSYLVQLPFVTNSIYQNTTQKLASLKNTTWYGEGYKNTYC